MSTAVHQERQAGPAKAAEIDLRYSAAAGPKAVVRLGEIFAA